MKAARLVIGSVSIFAFGIGIALAIVNGMLSKEIAINAVGIGNSASVLAFSAAFAIAGLVATVRRNRQGSDIMTGVLYWLTALIGLIGLSVDGVVVIWSIPRFVWIVVAAIFGTVFTLPARPSSASRGGIS